MKPTSKFLLWFLLVASAHAQSESPGQSRVLPPQPEAPQAQEIQRRLVELEVKKAEMARAFEEKARQIDQARASQQEMVEQRRRDEAAQLEQTLSALKARIDDLQARGHAQPQAGVWAPASPAPAHAPSGTAPIERRVLLAQLRAACGAIDEASAGAGEAEEAAAAATFQTTLVKYADWVDTLQRQYAALGSVPEDENPEADDVAESLNQTAWNLLTDERQAATNPRAALKVANAAVALAKTGADAGAPAHMLDTRARALFMTGSKKEAVQQQQQAVAAAEGSAEQELLQRTLAGYQRNELQAAQRTAPFATAEDPTDPFAPSWRAAAAVDPFADAAGAGDSPSRVVNGVAWELLTNPEQEKRAPQIALSLAEAAGKLAGRSETDTPEPPEIADTRARALFQLERRAEAIELQKKAIAACGDTQAGLKEELESTLAAYEKNEEPTERDADASPATALAQGRKLNEIAWDLVAAGWNPQETLKLADAAIILIGSNPEQRKHALDTRARAAFQAGQKDDAIATEKQAIQACGPQDGTLKKLFEKTLASYVKGVLPPAESPGDASVEGAATVPAVPVVPSIAVPARPGVPAAPMAVPMPALRRQPSGIPPEDRAASPVRPPEPRIIQSHPSAAVAPAAGEEERRNSLAWKMLKDGTPGAEQGRMALTLVEPALASVMKDSPLRKHLLDTKARALFAAERKDDAIATEQEAIQACGEQDQEIKALFERTLESYRKGELPGVE